MKPNRCMHTVFTYTLILPYIHMLRYLSHLTHTYIFIGRSTIVNIMPIQYQHIHVTLTHLFSVLGIHHDAWWCCLADFRWRSKSLWTSQENLTYKHVYVCNDCLCRYVCNRYVCMYEWIKLRMCVSYELCTNLCMYACFVFMYVCMYVCMYVYLKVCMNVSYVAACEKFVWIIVPDAIMGAQLCTVRVARS